ncbi:hypothetical protein [Brevibacillus sp. IT-7CA2]|uniref:hypothetical protein n=1 Tax=Brevibacillus sp. IT-7CA2 TaxID=3026436 RepID=UPI0039DFDD33
MLTSVRMSKFGRFPSFAGDYSFSDCLEMSSGNSSRSSSMDGFKPFIIFGAAALHEWHMGSFA